LGGTNAVCTRGLADLHAFNGWKRPRAHFSRAVYERLKPGGSYVIVDHAAAVGAGTSDAQSLHRIEPASVREEVEAAGFVLDAESTMLANKDDPHSIKVFDPSIKGETDRFAYRFVKP
jgi:predicted methyltransferase